jgi:hypothetical protein
VRILTQHLCLKFVTFSILYYHHVCRSPACLQFWPNPPHKGHHPEKNRRCGAAAQRWRARKSTFYVLAMNSMKIQLDCMTMLSLLMKVMA